MVAMPDEPASGRVLAAPPARVIMSMAEAECRAVLERQRLCVVSVVDDGEPYAVPVFYGFDGATLYLGTSEGRKTRALDANSRVYILVTEVGPGDAWRSVALAGHARTLTTEAERQRAIEVLIAHNRRVRESTGTTSAQPRRVGGGRILCVEDASISGRSLGWSGDSSPDASER